MPDLTSIPDTYPDTYEGLRSLLAVLRGPDGCPWDKEQTHSSLKRTIREECYEVLEAIDNGDDHALAEELGDLLMQIGFQCQIAEEMSEFTTERLFRGLNQKLIRRHPHVFGNHQASSASEAEHHWDRLKRMERGGRSSIDQIPKDLPALASSQLIQERAARFGFDWETAEGILEKVEEETHELLTANSNEDRQRELGDLLFSLVNVSRRLNIHAEDALTQANNRFVRRFAHMESRCRIMGDSLSQLSPSERNALWQAAEDSEG